MSARGFTVAAVAGLALLAGCDSRVSIEPAAHRADVDAWRTYRYDLLDEEGWLLLTGLYWLEPGMNTIGASDQNDIVLDGANVPDRVGTVTVADTHVVMTVLRDVRVMYGGTRVTEMLLEPGSWRRGTVLSLGTLNWHVIGRGDRYALRVRDSLASSYVRFDSIPSYPLNPDWRLRARFERYDPPKTILVPSVLGDVNENPSPGAAVFRVGLRTYRLDVLGQPADSMFWIQFGDETNGTETYGGGRYIWINAPDADGYTTVDFNKSYNPPCVFTAYATCPLPPSQNRLPLRIEAGELEYR